LEEADVCIPEIDDTFGDIVAQTPIQRIGVELNFHVLRNLGVVGAIWSMGE